MIQENGKGGGDLTWLSESQFGYIQESDEPHLI
jgi:hypothetical protein